MLILHACSALNNSPNHKAISPLSPLKGPGIEVIDQTSERCFSRILIGHSNYAWTVCAIHLPVY